MAAHSRQARAALLLTGGCIRTKHLYWDFSFLFQSSNPFARRLSNWCQMEKIPPWPQGETCALELTPLP